MIVESGISAGTQLVSSEAVRETVKFTQWCTTLSVASSTLSLSHSEGVPVLRGEGQRQGCISRESATTRGYPSIRSGNVMVMLSVRAELRTISKVSVAPSITLVPQIL